MGRNVFVTVLVGSLLLLAIALFIPGGAPDPDPKLPWKINVDAAGNSTVFGLTLGKSTLADGQQILSDIGEADLLISKDGSKSLEAYFNGIFLNGLKADFVFMLELDAETIEGMYQRGLQLSALESGIHKVDLTQEDLDIAASAKIAHITYLPKTDLDEALITNLFGEPHMIVHEPDSSISHWLYPDKGLDIAVDPDRKEVFQYVAPAKFDLISEPLKQAAAAKQEQESAPAAE
jgi:hypothetical protein